MDLRQTIQRLNEAKNIGAHAAAKNPWKHHAIVATVGAALRPGRHQALQDVGQRIVYPEYSRLESQFRRELTDVFSNLSTYTNRRVKRMFRTYYTQAFKLGNHAAKGAVGRPAELSPEDKRWLETFLRKEFDLWKKFMEQVRSASVTKMVQPPDIRVGGKLVTPPPEKVVAPADPKKMKYESRLEMYVQALRSMYNSSRAVAAPPMTLYYWETTPAEHCKHCLYLARMSPFLKENLPTVPASGDTQCLSNCRCHLQMKQVSIVEYMRVKRGAPTRETILRGMRALSN